MKETLLAMASLVVATYTLLANGGAWQTGVPGTGSASASTKNRYTDVTIEDERLKIDLHPEDARVEVHYRMHNTGPKAEQEFFFPVERWGKNPDADTDGIENSENITNEQRELARWLVDHGVDLVVGSHPHCVQPLDFYHGYPIAYSLGNLVFDGASSVASWNHSALLEAT